jgi:8-oxo-dGTP pyrophosphatase MutT (NUDIX family)
MKRRYLLALLERYHPLDSNELIYKQQIIDVVQQNSDCFDRSRDLGHITASAWLIDKQGTHALLMHHRKLNNWFQLGGHCDGDSNVLSVAIKEAQEESGINHIVCVSDDIFDIDVHLIPKTATECAHYHYDIRFLLQVTSDEQVRINNESKELRWVGKHKLDLPTQSPSVVRMFDKWSCTSLS